MKEDDFMKELKDGFLTEAFEMLVDVESYFIDLEKNPSDNGILDNIFRVAHNLKGTSGTVGFNSLANFLHKYEDVLSKIRKGELKINKNIIDLLLECVDRLKINLNDLKNDFDKTTDNFDLVKRMDLILDESINESNEKYDTSMDSSSGNDEEKRKGLKKEEYVRISLSKIDNLVDSFSEQIILQSALLHLKNDVIKNKAMIGDVVGQLNNLTLVLRQNVVSLRMLPMKKLFSKMKRIVRDTSQNLGKQIELITDGETAEVDKSILDAISNPLTHLIRNAVDHGIETIEERIKNGKNSTGRIFLKAYQDCGLLKMIVEDDGQGLDTEKLFTKALTLGIIDEDLRSSEEHLNDLIFKSGFTTKDEVTEVSGRGVGMDIVKSQIDTLGGTIKIKNRKGHGIKFEISLPLTLAVIDGLLIEVDRDKFVIPLNIVDECVELKPSNFVWGNGRDMIEVRNQLVPFIRLSDFFGTFKENRKNEKAVIFKINGENAAILVDQILGDCQTVIKTLGKFYEDATQIAGGTILGDGKVALILDVNRIFYDSVKKEEQQDCWRDDLGRCG